MSWLAPAVATALVLVIGAWVTVALAARTPGLPTALQLVPDVAGLARSLLRDPSCGRRVRWWLLGLLGYLLLPIDLVPDVIPVIGWADDVVVALWVLRRVVALAGPEVIAAHWPGSAEGLALLRRLLRAPA